MDGPSVRRSPARTCGVQARVVVELLEVDLDPVQGAPVDVVGLVGFVGDRQVEHCCAVLGLASVTRPREWYVENAARVVVGAAQEVGDSRRVGRDGVLELRALALVRFVPVSTIRAALSITGGLSVLRTLFYCSILMSLDHAFACQVLHQLWVQ